MPTLSRRTKTGNEREVNPRTERRGFLSIIYVLEGPVLGVVPVDSALLYSSIKCFLGTAALPSKSGRSLICNFGHELHPETRR